MDDKNVLIICVTIIICVLLIAGTLLLINKNNDVSFTKIINSESNDNKINVLSEEDFNVNSVTFYSDGNPNTGETATVNVGKEHSGETVDIITLYSRDGSQMNYPSTYETHTVDVDGNVMITDYTPMPKYPDYCRIEIIYNGNKHVYECDIAKHKGTQTAIPREL
ncbi:MAG: hypothetical protein BZ135_00400 [Methanosphaera sp. rholeuAM6]|nr:MAG: hypothetical protein BZ135_00400 [Methanosphaera sp. rholeuAM6]